jgi:hypothetical protein
MAAIGWLYYPRPSCGRHRCQVVASRLDVIIRQVRPHFFALTALGYARKTWKILISGMTSPNRACDLLCHQRQMMTSCLPFPEAQYGTGKKS